MRRLLGGLCLAVAALLFSSPVAALDCVIKPTEIDRLLCSSDRLDYADDAMWNQIQPLRELVSDDEYESMVAEQRRWLDQWARSCDSKASPAGTATCLEPALSERLSMVARRYHKIADGRHAGPSFEIGGLPLTIRMIHPFSGNMVIGDIVIAHGVHRIEPLSRYRNASVDAIAVVASSGGASYHCPNFPVYVVAVRGGQAEVTRVPARFGNRRFDACVAAERTAKGFVFTVAPGAALDGWSQEWTPEGGLTSPEVVPFAPRPGTTMRDYRDGRLVDNEQFFQTLRHLAMQAGEPVDEWAASFGWAGDPMIVDDVPGFRVFDGCSAIRGGGMCYNDVGTRAVYDKRADKLYLTRIKGEVDCPHDWRDREPNYPTSSIFLPPRQEWPDETLAALKRSYCGPHWPK